jgi:tetratricopeptide (TPR) repeat protein
VAYTLGQYVKLLLFPHPLTWDYYPFHISLHNFSDRPVYTSILVYIVLVLLALWGLRNKRVYSWAVLFYLVGISLATNIIFGIGTFMAERFLYLSSLSFAILIAWLATTRLPVIFTDPKTGRQVAHALVALVLLLYTGKTISRNKAWKDDYSLYTTDVITSANSAKSNNMAAQWFAFRASRPEYAAEKEAYLEKALIHARKAVKIHPRYQDAWFALGNIYFDYKKDIDSTLYCYSQILKLDPEENNVFRNLVMVLGTVTDRAAATRYWQQVQALNPSRFETNYNLAVLYSTTDLPTAIDCMLRAEAKQPQNPDVLKFLGDASYVQKDYQKTKYYWEKAIKNGATDPQIRNNLILLEPLIKQSQR